jgi:DnaJ-class molecular chaperone
MGLFSKSGKSGKSGSKPDCGACDGAGVIQTGTNKWTGATFSTCPACGGSGK